MSFLTDLYQKKGWSLRRISNELSCSKTTVRKKLVGAGIELIDQKKEHVQLRAKINEMRDRGQSYQQIADAFNLWGVKTRTGEGQWHAKTVRDISDS